MFTLLVEEESFYSYLSLNNVHSSPPKQTSNNIYTYLSSLNVLYNLKQTKRKSQTQQNKDLEPWRKNETISRTIVRAVQDFHYFAQLLVVIYAINTDPLQSWCFSRNFNRHWIPCPFVSHTNKKIGSPKTLRFSQNPNSSRSFILGYKRRS